MMRELRKWWESRSPRDRAVIAGIAALAALLLYAALVISANRARARLEASVAALRTQALRLDQDATELARVRAIRVPASAPSDLRTQLQTLIAGSGLQGGLLRIDASDADHAQMVFGSIPFAEWLQWVASLQAQRIRLESGRVEALSTPGMVGITATFARARAQ